LYNISSSLLIRVQRTGFAPGTGSLGLPIIVASAG
jgi:hypothetical protein